ncbi:hypothetical protein MLD38_037607 [Melastoma candidum]|uniref:Uncharacterized protein n=1 Tax=Melastoma candidum TaxID=119954 RepID=A0ACB9LNK8_9MYRT|nr:hypothetical protein MLD38_037607 [Melastoma candidum]
MWVGGGGGCGSVVEVLVEILEGKKKMRWGLRNRGGILVINDGVRFQVLQVGSEERTWNYFLHVISVIGDEGTGKTALVRSMYNRPDMERDFRCRAWISNYNTPNLESVLLEIWKQSPVMTLKDLELKETDKLCEFLQKTLMELRYLIVLDDLKSAEILDNLLLLVGQLDPEYSCKLLSEHSSINDEGLIDKILGKCRGSPPKILLFGGLSAAFENSDPDSSPMAWLCNLEEDWRRQDDRSLSYNSLPSWVKPCFLYLCLFPKEYEISTRRMFPLWHAEGLVRWDGHFLAEACFQGLANRNLVQVVRRREMDGGPKTCRVSGYLHDHFSEFASKFGHICDLQNANQEKSGIRLRHVEQLLKVPAANRDSSLLRVLDLEDVYKLKLPKQFGYLLPNLRYLGRRWTILDSLPESVSKLSILETIDLKYSNVTELLSSILRLKYLRHLYLNEGPFDKYNPKECFLGSLQTLWGLSMGAKGTSLTVQGKLKGLKKLGLACYAPVIPEVIKTISTMTKLKMLRLRSRDLFGQPSYLNLSDDMKDMQSISKMYLLGSLDEEGLSCLPKSLRVLTLSLSEMYFDPMDYLLALSDLVTLRLFDNSYIGKYMVFGKDTFPCRRVLQLLEARELGGGMHPRRDDEHTARVGHE